MQLTTVMGQKGSQGKSTITMALANFYHWQKRLRVLVIDADDRQLSIWRKRKRDFEYYNGTAADLYDVKPFNSPTRAVWSNYLTDQSHYDHVIVDTAGSMIGEDKKYLLRVSEKIVVPVNCNELDIDSMVQFLDAVADLGHAHKTYVVRNFYDSRNPDWKYWDEHFSNYRGTTTVRLAIAKRVAISRMNLTTMAMGRMTPIELTIKEIIDYDNAKAGDPVE